jgi:caa(3)-type oxidase subunit IV
MHEPPSQPALQIGPHEIEEARRHMRTYLIVGVALIIGTVLTVWASKIHFPNPEMNIVAALMVACTKGFLVAGFFMHLISEKKLIYSVMVFTVFFFSALMYLTLWSLQAKNLIHIH